ncbi:glycosyltransferase family 39 protein [Haladaptatus sp. CMAA 1911]|uniref:glycosyltransferase family 39 protein n=1 Tax=unclassified Haladaptatus TaxID=2622732 RepID=UPI0037543933
MTENDSKNQTTEPNNSISSRYYQQFEWIINNSVTWLVPSILIGTILVIGYLRTHPYPAFGAGLYLLMAGRIVDHGYALPQVIPYYTSGGLPFAYPPFGLYLAAILRDWLNMRPLTIARILPGILTVGYLIPAYALAEQLLESRPKASLAAIIIAVTPPVLQWHLSAGGFVRAPAFGFVILGLYAGLLIFRDQDTRWLPVASIAFAMTVLSHPQYTVFFIGSFALQWFVFDRSFDGIRYGWLTGLGGILLTAPWWMQVIQTHGVDIFVAAAGAQGGIGGNLSHLKRMFRFGSMAETLYFFWGPVSLLGSLYLLARRRVFLPAWLLLASLVLDKARFPFFVGAFLSAPLIIDGAKAAVRPFTQTIAERQIGVSSLVLGIVLLGGVAGGLYVTSSINTHAGSQSLPAFMDKADVSAMQWVQQNTAPTAQFIVFGDTAEWFPQQAHRTIIVGPWGVEWMGKEAYRTQIQRFRRISTCETSDCVTDTLQKAHLSPDFLYVPKGRFTVRGIQHRQTQQTITSLRASARYQQVFENDGVVIFKTIPMRDINESTHKEFRHLT